MVRSPGFVLVLAAVFACFGKSLIAVQILNFVFSLATALIVYFLTKDISNDRSVAWAAAFFSLFFPGSFIAESRGGVESFFTLCIAATFLLAYKSERARSYYFHILVGIVFGFAVLVKASVALMLPAFWLYRLVTRRRLTEVTSLALRYSAAGLVAALVSVPWIVRNYHVSGEFIPTMTVGGMSIDQGLYVIKNYTLGEPHWKLLMEASARENVVAKELGLEFRKGYYPRFYRTRDEVTFYNKLRDSALKEYWSSPALTGRAILINSLAFWFQGRSHEATLINIAITLPVLVFFCGGLLIAKRRDYDYWGVIVALAAFIAPHLLILSISRYYVPVVPLLAPYVALFCTRIFASHLKRKRSNTDVLPGGI